MDETETTKTRGTGPWYAAAVLATGVSVDTSWRFFGEVLGITSTLERIALFAVLEVMLTAAGYAMHHNVKRTKTPGSARIVAWSLAAVSGYMAVEMSGPLEGVARVVLGPVLAIVALHQALGIEIKARHGERTGTLAKVGREMRERALSRLGLGDDERDAKRRTAERAAVKAATIATSKRPSMRRLRAQVLKAGPAQRALIMDTAAALKSLDRLVDMDMDSPWAVSAPVQPVRVPRVPRPRNAPVSGGPAITWDVAKVVRMVQDGIPSAEIQAIAAVSAKTVQRVTRVVDAGSIPDADVARGDLSLKFVQTVRKAMA